METKKIVIDGKKIAIGAAKIVAGTLASFGTAFIVTRYGKGVIKADDKKVTKLLMTMGAYILGNMVGNAADKYVGEQIETAVESIEKVTKIGKTLSGIHEDDDEFDFEEEDA